MMLFGGFGMIFTLIFIVAIIVAAMWALARLFPQSGAGPSSAETYRSERRGSALDILKERYARGEITKAEYEDMRRDLQK
ncbi:MAG TPA: SHOCT domain-containing protein [Anaerolineales bacterium]|nr:SHOCT domain-containing protein [Anaerolineales bacterium]